MSPKDAPGIQAVATHSSDAAAIQPEETAFTTRFSFRGTRRRNSSTTRMLTATKAMSNVR